MTLPSSVLATPITLKTMRVPVAVRLTRIATVMVHGRFGARWTIGFRREDVDGLIVGPTLSSERTGEILGINPSWSSQADSVNAILQGALALHCGVAECVALVYGNDQRTAGTKYGGPNHGASA